MGALDSNNIYIYDETDSVAPFHTLLNMLGGSVGPAIQAMYNEWNNSNMAPFRLWIGQQAFENTLASQHVNVNFTFPQGRFTMAPMTWAQAASPRSGQFLVTTRVHSPTTTGVSVNVGTIITGTGQTFPISGHVNLLAIQLNPNSVLG